MFEPMRGIALKSVDSWDAAIGGDAISSANCVLNCLKWKRQGTFIFDIDQTYCSQQGKLTENAIIRGEKTKRPRRARTSRRSTRSGGLTVS